MVGTRRWILAAVLLFVVGCASKEWRHTNPRLHNNETFTRDQADCMQHARALMGEPNGQPGTPEYGLWKIHFVNAFDQCMNSRGWEKV